MEDIAIEGHFADIGAHISDTHLFHVSPDDLQPIKPHPYIDSTSRTYFFLAMLPIAPLI